MILAVAVAVLLNQKVVILANCILFFDFFMVTGILPGGLKITSCMKMWTQKIPKITSNQRVFTLVVRHRDN